MWGFGYGSAGSSAETSPSLSTSSSNSSLGSSSGRGTEAVGPGGSAGQNPYHMKVLHLAGLLMLTCCPLLKDFFFFCRFFSVEVFSEGKYRELVDMVRTEEPGSHL